MAKEASSSTDSDSMGGGVQSQSTSIHPRGDMSALTWALVLLGVYLGSMLYGLFAWHSEQ